MTLDVASYIAKPSHSDKVEDEHDSCGGLSAVTADNFTGVVTLEAAAFDEFVLCMTTTQAPTEAILKGAELLRSMRPPKP